MLKVLLFLFIQEYGWVRVGVNFDNFNECTMVQHRFITSDPDITEGFCCVLTESQCLTTTEEIGQ
jgi:hypothetical protein